MGLATQLPVVRDYVMAPERRVKDRRTGESTADVDGVLNGGLDGIMAGVIRYRAAKRRAQ